MSEMGAHKLPGNSELNTISRHDMWTLKDAQNAQLQGLLCHR